MTANTTVGLVVSLAPILVPAAIALTRFLLDQLPSAQRKRAEVIVAQAVRAAEQMYAAVPGSGEQKKAEVEQLLTRLGVKINPALLTILLESAVASLPASSSAQPPAN